MKYDLFNSTSNDQTYFDEALTNNNINIRLGFIKKVYGILSFQILFTFLFILISFNSKAFSHTIITNTPLFIISLILTFLCPICITCFKDYFKVPYNYILLGLFTVSESYLVSYICLLTNPNIVIMSACMTFAVTVSLTVYAYRTTNDFTIKGGMIFILAACFLMLSIFGLFTNNKMFHIILSCLGVALYGVYLIYDTQLILGKMEFKFEIDDYILASFMLYIDIINLFLELLRILRYVNSD